ncbi:MAG: family 78 glycoside hydrolase catalytic domain [Prolixibacteraceae bacterium]
MRTCISLLFVLVFISCAPSKVDFEVADLRCEYLTNPTGIDVPIPRLSWKMKSAKQGATQTAYHILVASSDSLLRQDKGDLWDSGMTKSDQSSQVEYHGKPLNSGEFVYWKVRIRNQKHFSSPWSKSAWWEMGLLKKEDWKALWIGAPEAINTGNWKLPAPQFRREVNLSKPIKKARAYISGLGYYELSINGKKIGDHLLSPNQTNYDKRRTEKWSESRIGNMTTTVLYETFDISNNLATGRNVFGVLLGNGWYIQADRPGDTMLWYNTPRLIAQFDIEYQDGTKELITSDESWKCSVSPIIYNGLHTGEIYDARLEQSGWNTPGFDDAKWLKAELVQSPTGILKSQVSPSDRLKRTIRPVSVTEKSKGVYRYDLGEMISGWARLKITGPKGTTLQLHFTEELGPGYDQSDTYILKGSGEEIWEPRFTWHAFRYVDVSGSPSALTIENVEGRVVNTDIQPAGTFECSNQLLNQILDNYRRTQLGNVHGGLPSDCPHRERRGYTGDGQISAEAAIYNFDLQQFYTKWMNDIHDARNHETGYVPNTVPYQDGGGGTAWGAAYVIIPWYMYQYYGDTRILEDHYEGMKHWITFMKSQLNKDGILVNQGLGEWVPPEAVELPADFVNSCYYFHCCRLMTEISDVLDKANDHDYFQQLADKAKKDINNVWLNKKTYNYSSGKQGANVFPLGFGITEEQKTDSIFNNLLNKVVADNKAHFDTGILATPLLLDVLTEYGRMDIAYTLMNQRDYPGYGYMIEKGATTIWETWLGDASHSHPMFGSVCAWFYKSLGGISPDSESPGFKKIRIKPIPVKAISYVNCSYPTAYGTITSNWKLNGADYQLEVSIPANSNATVYVLAQYEKGVLLNGSSLSGNQYVKFLRMEDSFAVFEVASGHYNFTSKSAGNLLQKTILPTPMIHPGDTLVNSSDSVRVQIISDVKDSKIYYTTNGNEPDTLASLYSRSFVVSNPSVIKAKTYLKGFETSYTSTSRIDFVDEKVNGLNVNYYVGSWMKLPDFTALPVVKTGNIFNFSLKKISSPEDKFALIFEGKIMIKKSGTYQFFLQSNDGSRLLVDNSLVIDNDGAHGADTEETGKIELTEGIHPIKLHYFQAGGGMFLEVKYAGPDVEKQTIPAAVLFRR